MKGRHSTLRAGKSNEIVNANMRRLVKTHRFSKSQAVRIAFRKAGRALPENYK